MAILTKDELLKAIQDKLTTSDDDLTILENITDTINSLSSKENEDWKKKFEDNDKAWRERYKARFSQPVEVPNSDPEPHLPDEGETLPKSANITIDELFTD